eukprot:RCo047703
MPETLWVQRQRDLRLAADKDCPEPCASVPEPRLPGVLPGIDSDLLSEGDQPLPDWGALCPLCPALLSQLPFCTVACFDLSVVRVTSEGSRQSTCLHSRFISLVHDQVSKCRGVLDKDFGD